MNIIMLLEGDFFKDNRVIKEANTLSSSGFNVVVASASKDIKTFQKKFDSIEVWQKKMPLLVYKSSIACLRFPVYFLFWKRYIRKLMKKQRFDFIHVHDLPLSKVGLFFSRKHNARLIIDNHENYPELLLTAEHTKSLLGRILFSYKSWLKYEKKMFINADRIITVVEEMKNRLIHKGIDKNKIYILENVMPISQLPVMTDIPDPNYSTIFFGGGVLKNRGLQIVLEGIKKVAERNDSLRLWIVGSGKFLPKLKQLAVTFGIVDLITFYEYLPLEKLLRLLSVSDIALIPHLRSIQSDHSSPNKLFQYMAMGKPIISSNCKSIERIINETGAGFVYRHDSPEEFATLLQDIISNPHKLSEASKNGFKAVREKYNWENYSRNLLDLYNSF